MQVARSFYSHRCSFSTLRVHSSYESIADILQRELGTSDPSSSTTADDRNRFIKRRNIPEKRRAFIEETLAVVSDIIRGTDATKLTNAAHSKRHEDEVVQEKASQHPGPARLSRYGVIRLLISRVSSKNWIELDRDMRNYQIVLRPSEVAWVLKVEKDPHKAWDFFNWASRKPGYRHDSACFLIMIDSLGKCSDFLLLEDLLSDMERLRVPYDLPTVDRLIEIFSYGDYLCKVEHYLQKIRELNSEPSTQTYKCMLCAFARAGKYEKALEILTLLRRKHEILDISSYSAIFNALMLRNGKIEDNINDAIRFFQMMLEDGITADASMCRVVVKLLSEGNQTNRAVELLQCFNEKVSRKEVCERLLRVMVEFGYWQDILVLIQNLKCSCVTLSQATLLDLVDAFCQANKFFEALSIMRQMEKDGLDPPQNAYNSIITALCHNNQYRAAYDVLKLMKERCILDIKVCAMIIEGLGNIGELELAVNLLEDVDNSEHLLDRTVFNSFLQVAACIGDVQSTLKLLQMMHMWVIPADIATYNKAIECFGRAGKLDLALKVFKEMTEKGCSPSVATYNNILLASSLSGQEDSVLSFYEEMKTQGLLPDTTTFSILSTISRNHVGLDERYFTSMNC